MGILVRWIAGRVLLVMVAAAIPVKLVRLVRGIAAPAVAEMHGVHPARNAKFARSAALAYAAIVYATVRKIVRGALSIAAAAV